MWVWMIPSALAWTSPLPQQGVRSRLFRPPTPTPTPTPATVVAAHKDTFDEINRELQELQESDDDLYKHKLQKELQEAQTKIKELQEQLQESIDHLADYRVVFLTTERELHREIRDRKAEKNSYRLLLKSMLQLTQKHIQHAFKALTNKRWRRLTRSVRKEQKKNATE